MENIVTTEIGTINITPRWADIIEIYIYALQNGSGEALEGAKAEVRRIADIADAYNDRIKAEQEYTATSTTGRTEGVGGNILCSSGHATDITYWGGRGHLIISVYQGEDEDTPARSAVVCLVEDGVTTLRDDLTAWLEAKEREDDADAK